MQIEFYFNAAVRAVSHSSDRLRARQARLLKSADSHVLSVVMVYAVVPYIIINAFQVDYFSCRCYRIAVRLCAGRRARAASSARAALRPVPLRLDVIDAPAVVYTNAAHLVIRWCGHCLAKDYVIYSCAFLVGAVVDALPRSARCTRGFAWKKIIGNVEYHRHRRCTVHPAAAAADILFSLGAMARPIGMLLAGIVIADTPLFRQLFMRRRHYVPVLLPPIICPIITVLLLRVIGAASWIPDGHSILLTVYLACITPACATVTSMAQLYDRDAEYSECTVCAHNAVLHPHHAADGMGV